MRRKKWFLTLAILAATSGCAGLEDCRYETAQRLRAMAQYHECGAPACERFPKDYKRGYLDGFYAVSTGGPCCPPAVAPSKYWRVSNVLGECDNPRHSYYSGWQDGASRASCFPDTHHLRIFETCKCTVPRCEGCGPQGVCNTAPGACGCNQGLGDGLIHGEYGVPTGTVIGNDPIYSEAYAPLPETIPAPITSERDVDNDDDEDDAAGNDADPDSDDANDADRDTADQNTSDRGTGDRALDEADEQAPPKPSAEGDASDDDMELDTDDVISPSDVQSERSDASDPSANLPDAQTLGRLHRSGSERMVADDRLIPIEGWDAGMVDSDFDVAVVRPLDDAVDPSLRSVSRDQRFSAGSTRDLPTDELEDDATRVESAPVQPLDRGTIQALFGVDRMFDPSATGTVSYQESDPVKAVDEPTTTSPVQSGATVTDSGSTTDAKSDAAGTGSDRADSAAIIAPLFERPESLVREAAFDPAGQSDGSETTSGDEPSPSLAD